MAEELIQVQLAKKERQYIKIYKDFFRCSLLDATEKLVYIGLKDFLNFTDDSGEVFPSLTTLAKHCSVNERTIRRTLQSLEAKGVIKKERRGLTKTNLYTLNDNPEMWRADTIEQMQAVAESKIELSTEEMLEELKRRGAIEIIDKKIEFSFTDQSKNENTNNVSNVKFNSNDNTCITESQEVSEEDVKAMIEYDYLIREMKSDKHDLDAVVSIIYEAYNTTKDTIKIGDEEKPKAVVVSVLSKLDYEDILDVLKAYENEQHSGTVIYNHEAYLRKMLYKAKLQHGLRLNNQGRNNHDW